MKKLFPLLLIFQVAVFAQTVSNKIIIDQIGYRPFAKKVAILKNPQTGFDASDFYLPSDTLYVVNALNDTKVFKGPSSVWNNGVTDASSGDKVWWFDFSDLSVDGTYYILDEGNNKKSFDFEIRKDVYNEALKQAFRVFYYQRVGVPKLAEHAGANWADGASHVGPLQDKNCRIYSDPQNVATERDVSGGWYDAGDYNKYTTWTSNYIVDLVRSYNENPTVWGDDYDIPESGNGIPDIVDEIKFGTDHLLRLQNTDGSMIAIVSEDGASPPSTATGQSLYGGVNTSSALSSSGAFSIASMMFRQLGMTTYADSLLGAAKDAYSWANNNPNVLWKNNDAASGTQGVGAGQQEVSDYQRMIYKLRASVFLFEITDETQYQIYFDNNYEEALLIKSYFAQPFNDEDQDVLLHYSSLDNATLAVKVKIKSRYNTAINGSTNFGAITSQKDPYRSYMKDYVWGSNRQKSSFGLMYLNVPNYDINPSRNDLAYETAEEYIHYLHGVNPLNLMYLSNMYDFGGDNCVNEFYHNWFYDKTDYDHAQNSLYGPPPGYVVGGANPSYSWDNCCNNNSCGSDANNAKCFDMDVSDFSNQPTQKAYINFNNNWPLNSWSLSENSNGYQIEYIRLLSNFVEPVGTVTNINSSIERENSNNVLYPNPVSETLHLDLKGEVSWELMTINGLQLDYGNTTQINVSTLEQGVYILKVEKDNKIDVMSFVKE